MNLFTAVEKRYSYRDAYTKARVPRSALRKIVAAGLKAPSGCNAQTTTFVIVDDPRKMAVIRTLHSMTAVQQAKAAIVCIIHRKPPFVFRGRDSFEVEDCSAAVENMLLAITALGYGSVWIDGYLREPGQAAKLNRLLRVPRDRTVRVMLPVGVPAVRGPRRAKKPFSHRAWFNTHG